MLIPAEAWAALLEAGVTVRPVGAQQVELAAADDTSGSVVLTVQRRKTPLAPSHVRAAVSGRPALVVAPSATDAALTAAADAGWSVIALDAAASSGPRGLIRLPGRDVVIGRAAAGPHSRGRPGPQPWRTYALVRRMFTVGPFTQVELARAAGVTQPLVSQTLTRLRTQGLVERVTTSSGPRWRVVDRRALVNWWLNTYPGPGGITTYWFGLAAPVEQARTAIDQLQATGPVAVSGDVAADLIAPWRRPLRAVVYAAAGDGHAPLDLSLAGLTPSGADEATLELIVPGDRSVFANPVLPEPQLPLADGLQVAWDLRRAAGTDADQALAALLGRLTAEDYAPDPAR